MAELPPEPQLQQAQPAQAEQAPAPEQGGGGGLTESAGNAFRAMSELEAAFTQQGNPIGAEFGKLKQQFEALIAQASGGGGQPSQAVPTAAASPEAGAANVQQAL